MALARGEPAAHGEATAEPHGADGHGGAVHWTYEGENGPQNWSKLKPEFNLCGIGKRQSPIAIQSDATLQGPAEPLQFNYTPSLATVVNNGHTVQVDVEGDNSITVRSSSYRLVQFHFHTPSEEMVNSRRYAMVAHLVHKNEAGQLAVVAVLLEQGEANPLVDKVWTYMPLDTDDRVRMPDGLLNLNELLPKDQRYYQFMGSLTTPPCTEGVLWMVLKQPMKISAGQYKLFRQQFPLNARPVQPVNGRPVREAN
jgi:carbonic anhydrase